MTDAKPRRKILVILLRVFFGFITVLVLFSGFVALQPPEFSITRAATIAAPAPDVFAQVNDFHKWEAWSPWAKLDPAMKQAFEGPSVGTGAIYTWTGNDKVGEGRMTLTESRPSDLIRIKLDFVKPFEDTSMTEFTFKAEGAQTSVRWTMTGRKNFLSKAMCLFMDMDKLVGGDFERGLAQMKSVVEAAPRK